MQTLQMLAKIVSGGFCGACSIIIGNEIGRGDLNWVNRYCKKFHLTALIVGITSGIVVYSMINPMLDIYSIKGTEVGKWLHLLYKETEDKSRRTCKKICEESV
ncbi:hypothetical protein [Agathobacter sp.]|uniref:hypothetical protein n=1 Tax=Agathobacter sp. TaxID=2021311 RepID=UPI003AB6E988